jgi:hypothetical protein
MGATPEQIDLWKQQYGNIFAVTIRGVEYIFRQITFRELDTINRKKTSSDMALAEELLFSIAVLYPEEIDYEKIPAGIITSIGEEILDASGMGDKRRMREILFHHRERASDVRTLMKAFVLATMGAYKEEELDDLTFDQLAKKVILAEQIIKVNQSAFGVENSITLDLVDPEEEAQQAEAQAAKYAAQKKPGQAGFNDPIAQRLADAMGS